MSIGDANINELCSRIRGNFCGCYPKREKMHSDAIQAAVVDSLLSSKAFDFMTRRAFGDYTFKLPIAFSTRSSSGQRAGTDCFRVWNPRPHSWSLTRVTCAWNDC
jgi:hypothetical protein